MNEQFTKQAEEMFEAAKNIHVPENVQAMAEDGVARTREAYDRMNSVAQETSKAFEEIAEVAQKNARALGAQLMENLSANTEAAFDAAEAVVRSKTLPEAAKVQAEFVRQQMAKASEQTKEFYELSSKVARETAERVNTAATRSFEQMRADS